MGRVQDRLAILQRREERATSLSPVDVAYTGIIYITLRADDVQIYTRPAAISRRYYVRDIDK